MNTNNIVMWVVLPGGAHWDCFGTLILPEILKTLDRLQVEFFVYLDVIRLFSKVGCQRGKRVSYSSTESETVYLDASLRTDGIPALDLWDLVIEVLHSSLNQRKKSKATVQELAA